MIYVPRAQYVAAAVKAKKRGPEPQQGEMADLVYPHQTGVMQ